MEDVHTVNEFRCHTPSSDPYRMDNLQFDSWQGQDISLIFKTSRQSVELIQPLVHWVLGVPPPRVDLPAHKVVHLSPLSTRVTNQWSCISAPFFMPSWCEQGQL